MTKHMMRSCAFQALYSLSFAPANTREELERVFKRANLDKNGKAAAAELEQQPRCEGFIWELTHGVWKNEAKLNAIIEKFSRNWRIERMGLLEQILLRLGLYEMLFMGTPAKIVMSESMALADDFGATSSKSFVNGVLDAAAREHTAGLN